jgi:KDO2-lipid IV(A) lauroyltransferase
MGAVGFYLFFVINWIVTLLPLEILYLISDLAYLITYYIWRYRRKVVRMNLKNSFPEKSEIEIIQIEKKFYHHLCDILIESFKLTHMSNRQLMKRFPIENAEVLDRLYDQGRDVIAVLGHYSNWEWLICLPFYTKLQTVSIYKPLKNKYFDKFQNKLRSRNGMILTPMSNVIREVVDKRKNNIRSLYSIITDQTPPKGDIKFWIRFLNQDTPVYLGAEKIASRYDMAIVFFNIQKIRRGHYKLIVEQLFDHTAGLSEHFITKTHVNRLEEIIREKPENWIWSHRRWKHKRESSDV